MKARQVSTAHGVTQPRFSVADIDRLNARRVALGITLEDVAQAAAKTSRGGTCSIFTVSRVLSHATKSQNVVSALRRQIAERETRANGGRR